MTEDKLVEKMALAISGAGVTTTRSLQQARRALAVARPELLEEAAAFASDWTIEPDTPEHQIPLNIAEGIRSLANRERSA